MCTLNCSKVWPLSYEIAILHTPLHLPRQSKCCLCLFSMWLPKVYANSVRPLAEHKLWFWRWGFQICVCYSKFDQLSLHVLLLCNISQREKLLNWLNGVGEVSFLKLETLNLARYYQWHSCLVGWKLPMEMLFPRHNVVRSSIYPRVAWIPALKKLFLKSLSTPTWRYQVEAHINSWYAQLSWKTFPNFPSGNLSKTWELAKPSYAKVLKTSYKVQYRPYLRVQVALQQIEQTWACGVCIWLTCSCFIKQIHTPHAQVHSAARSEAWYVLRIGSW